MFVRLALIASVELELLSHSDEMVGIDVGILKCAHDTDGTAVESPDLSEERDRLEREQRKLSRKEYESNNWETQRRRVAACHLDIKRKRRDFLHKLSNYYAREYKLLWVRDTNGYNPVSDFDPPRGRICSRSYSRQYEHSCPACGDCAPCGDCSPGHSP